jgi:hypothetical protein
LERWNKLPPEQALIFTLKRSKAELNITHDLMVRDTMAVSFHNRKVLFSDQPLKMTFLGDLVGKNNG